MELSADGEKAVCPYCGQEMLFDNDDSSQEEYERCLARARAEEDIKDLQRGGQSKRRFEGWFIALFVFAGICLVNMLPGFPLHDHLA